MKTKALKYSYTKPERELRRSLLEKLASDAPEPIKDHYREQLQELRDGARARSKRKRAAPANPAVTMIAGIDCTPPIRLESDTETDWGKRVLLYKLNLKEAALQGLLHNPTKHSSGKLLRAINELSEIENRRRKLGPELFEDEDQKSTFEPAPRRKRPKNVSQLSDDGLRAEHEVQRDLHEHDYDRFSHIRWQELVREGQRRRLCLPDIFGNVRGESSLVKRQQQERDESPKPVPAPEPQPMREFTPAAAQREARQHWKNQYGAPVDRSFAFRIEDGTLFWRNGERVSAEYPLLRETSILNIKNPPSYVAGSGIVPQGWTIDVGLLIWRRVENPITRC